MRLALLLTLAGCVPAGGFDGGMVTPDSGFVASADAGVDAGFVTGWRMEIYAGSGVAGAADGPGSSAQFNQPTGLAIDRRSRVLVADTGNRAVRAIDLSQAVTTIAAQNLVDPRALAVDSRDTIYVSDTLEQCVKAIDVNQRVRTFAGTCAMGAMGFHRCYDSTAGTVGPGDIGGPAGLAVDEDAGVVYIVDAVHELIRFASMTRRELGTIAGREDSKGFRDGACGRSFCCGASVNFPGCTAVQASIFRDPHAVAIDGSGNLIVSDRGNCAIRKIATPAAPACQVSTVFGSECQSGTPRERSLNAPLGVAVDAQGRIYVADTSNQRVVMIDPSMPTLSRLTEISGRTDVVAPTGIAVDEIGRVFVSDSASNRIVVFSPP